MDYVPAPMPHRLPELSPEAGAFIYSILGRWPREVHFADLTVDQREQMLLVLEAEISLCAKTLDPMTAIRMRQIAEFAAALMRAETPPAKAGSAQV